MSDEWTYKVLTYKVGWKGFKFDQIEQELNEYGRQGWEVISTLAPSFGAGQAIEVAVIMKMLTSRDPS